MRPTPIIVTLISGSIGSFAAAAVPANYLPFNYDILDDGGSNPSAVELPGRLVRPVDYDPSLSYPLVVVFHGAGEFGKDNEKQVIGNIDNLLSAAAARGFFVYAPQESNGSWSTNDVDMAMRMVAKATQNYSIDTRRIAVTGLSAGGGATWTAISFYTNAFSAAAPVCAVTGTRDATKLVGKPIWAFHAKNDGIVWVGNTRNFINDIRNADRTDPAYPSGKPDLTFPLAGNTRPLLHLVAAAYLLRRERTSLHRVRWWQLGSRLRRQSLDLG